MRIIQSYNTFEDSRNLEVGFPTLRAFKKFLKDSYEQHKKLTDDYTIYTDYVGYEVVKEFIPESEIEVIEFESVANDRFKYAGKIQVAGMQTKPYLHVDLDLVMYKLPDVSDVMVEHYSHGILLGLESAMLKIPIENIKNRPWSGVIGFNDLEFRDIYIKEVRSRYDILERVNKVTYPLCFTLEEVLLQSLILKHKKEVSYLDRTDYLHLRSTK